MSAILMLIGGSRGRGGVGDRDGCKAMAIADSEADDETVEGDESELSRLFGSAPIAADCRWAGAVWVRSDGPGPADDFAGLSPDSSSPSSSSSLCARRARHDFAIAVNARLQAFLRSKASCITRERVVHIMVVC